jgi:Mn-dependent DtxR family transcriptional regulator
MKHSTKAITMAQVSRPNPLTDLTRVEDYLEVIYELIQKKGYARPADIAEKLDVRSASVTGMLQRLHGMELIVYERYRGLTLTSSGERLAKSVQQRHSTILKFLRILGIEEKIAQMDTEGIEHHIHPSTIARITRFVDYALQHPSWFKTFEDTLK